MKKDYPTVHIGTHDSVGGAYYQDREGNRWSVARLIQYAKELKVFECPLAALDLSGKIWVGSCIQDYAYHLKQINRITGNYPIILDWEGQIADGRHRIIKALADDKKTIKAVRFDWRPSPCSTDND